MSWRFTSENSVSIRGFDFPFLFWNFLPILNNHGNQAFKPVLQPAASVELILTHNTHPLTGHLSDVAIHHGAWALPGNFYLLVSEETFSSTLSEFNCYYLRECLGMML